MFSAARSYYVLNVYVYQFSTYQANLVMVAVAHFTPNRNDRWQLSVPNLHCQNIACRRQMHKHAENLF